MLTASKITSRSIDYYESSIDRTGVGADLDDYYSEHGDKPPFSFVLNRPGEEPVLADRLGVEDGQTLDREQVERWFGDGLTPGEDEQMGRPFREDSVRGWDLTMCAPKSVSMVWGLGDEHQAQAVEEAHRKAVSASLGYLSQHGSYSRKRDGTGAEAPVVPTAGISGAIYDHRTSRATDPHLHSHVIMHNRQLLADGSGWGSLDGTSLMHEMRAGGMIYQAQLRAEMSKSLGVEWEETDQASGMADLKGISRAQIEEWSQRHSEIDAWAEQHLDNDSAAGKDQAQKATRQSKDLSATTQELRDRWRSDDRAQAVDLSEVVDRPFAHIIAEPEPSVEAVLAHVAHRHSTFTRADLVESAATLWPSQGEADPADTLARIERIADTAQGVSVSLEAPAAQVDPSLSRDGHGRVEGTREGSIRYSTHEVIAQEAQAVTRAGADAGLGAEPERVPTEGLSTDQTEAMRALVGSGQRVSVLVAAAGTGKTTSLGAARSGWEADGRNVCGLAPTGRAADEMSQAGVASGAETVATVLGRLHRGDGTGWCEQSVVVVDEAGMVSTSDLSRLVGAATDDGARMVLVGDPHQLDAPGGRAGLLQMLADDLPDTQYLAEVFRQRDPAERSAGLKLRDGDDRAVADATTWYGQAGRLHAGDTSAMLEDAYTGWSTDKAQGLDSLLLAPTWEHAGALNRRAQADLIEAGQVDGDGGGLALAGKEVAHRGDTILSRKNDYGLSDGAGQPVRNGQRWKLAALAGEDGRAVLERVGDPTAKVSVPHSYLKESGRLGYAATIHSAQGVTSDTTHSILDGDRSARGPTYVAMTRGRSANHAYIASSAEDVTKQGDARREDQTGARWAFLDVLGRDPRDRSAHSVLRSKVEEHRAEHPDVPTPARDLTTVGQADAGRHHQAKTAADRMRQHERDRRERGKTKSRGLEL